MCVCAVVVIINAIMHATHEIRGIECADSRGWFLGGGGGAAGKHKST